MTAAEDLAKTIQDNFGGTGMMMGIVTGTDALADRSLIEVRLNTGSFTNAFAWTQADIQVGDDVVLGQIANQNGIIYTVLATNSPPLINDSGTTPNIPLWGGPTFRPERVPVSNGAVYVLGQTQQTVTFGFDTYTQMRIDLQFSIAPISSQIEWWLYGYDKFNVDFNVAPPWSLQMGTSWKSPDNKIWRTQFDMTAPGFHSEWIYDYDSALFVLAIKRVSASTTRAHALGRLQLAQVSFLEQLEQEPLELLIEGNLTVNPAPQVFTGVSLTAGGILDVKRWYESNPLIASIDGDYVRGPM